MVGTEETVKIALLAIALANGGFSLAIVFADMSDVLGTNFWLNLLNLGASAAIAGWLVMKGGPAERAAAAKQLADIVTELGKQHVEQLKNKDEMYGKMLDMLNKQLLECYDKDKQEERSR